MIYKTIKHTTILTYLSSVIYTFQYYFYISQSILHVYNVLLQSPTYGLHTITKSHSMVIRKPMHLVLKLHVYVHTHF